MQDELTAHLEAIWEIAKKRLGNPNDRRPDPKLAQVQMMINNIEMQFERAAAEKAKS